MHEAIEVVLAERCGALTPETCRELATVNLESLRPWLRLTVKAQRLEDVGTLPGNLPWWPVCL